MQRWSSNKDELLPTICNFKLELWKLEDHILSRTRQIHWLSYCIVVKNDLISDVLMYVRQQEISEPGIRSVKYGVSGTAE